MRPPFLVALAAVIAAASPPSLPTVNIRNSDTLRVTDMRLHLDGERLRLSGRICRRANRLTMQPSRLDIDRVGADGTLSEHADAYLPRLSLRIDQSCGVWQTSFKGPIAPGDTIRVCVPSYHGHCRGD
jgi:hypothetical protein